MHPTDAAYTELTHRKYDDLKMYGQGVNCVALGEIGLDHVRVRQDKGRDQQAEVFSRVYRLAKEVGKPVVIHCRGRASTAKECLWIMKDQMVHWHHFNETEESNLKEQLDAQLEKFIRSTSPERLMAESDAPMVEEGRDTNHPWAVGTVLKRIAAIKDVPLPIMRKICESSSSLVRGGVIFKPGMGMNYFLGFHFTCMHCGDVNLKGLLTIIYIYIFWYRKNLLQEIQQKLHTYTLFTTCHSQ